MLPGFFHDTLARRTGRSRSHKARDFILDRFAEPPGAPSLLDADRIGYTRDEADGLASPLPTLSPRGLYWAMVRANMRLGGTLSPRASRLAIGPASIRARPSTMSTATSRGAPVRSAG